MQHVPISKCSISHYQCAAYSNIRVQHIPILECSISQYQCAAYSNIRVQHIPILKCSISQYQSAAYLNNPFKTTCGSNSSKSVSWNSIVCSQWKGKSLGICNEGWRWVGSNLCCMMAKVSSILKVKMSVLAKVSSILKVKVSECVLAAIFD